MLYDVAPVTAALIVSEKLVAVTLELVTFVGPFNIMIEPLEEPEAFTADTVIV
jgi:hypothetical protein